MTGQNNFAQFITTNNGKFFFNSDKELKNSFDWFDGIITKLEFKTDEFQKDGKTIKTRKLYFTLSDGNNTYKIGVPTKLRDYTTIVGQLLNANLATTIQFNSKAIPLHNDKVGTGIFLSQNGGLKSAFSKEHGTIELPRWEKKTINGEEIWDKGATLAKIEEIVETQLIPIINANPTIQSSEPENREEEYYPETTPDVEDDSDDLPF